MRRLIACLCCCVMPVAMAAPVCVDNSPPTPVGRVAAMEPGDGGIGGTGHAPSGTRPDNEGVGGTGIEAAALGRTGLPLAAGESIGIVGVVTGFSSICVNGLKVDFDADTPVSENGRAARIASLAVGQFVSIDAMAAPGGLRARDVAIVHLMEGPVSARSGGGFAVMGQPVELLPNARLVDGMEQLTPGRMVKVSGMRTPDGQVRATRIALAPELDEMSVIGDVSGGSGEFPSIEGLPLSAERAVLLGAVRPGQVLAKGHWNGKSLVTTHIAPDPTLRFAPRIRKVVLEALLSGTPSAGDMTACGLAVKSDVRTLLKGAGVQSRLEARRVRISGRLDAQGRLDADYIDADLPPGLDPVSPVTSRSGLDTDAAARTQEALRERRVRDAAVRSLAMD
jgi:hypothetical protein